jgi:competence protein ComGF
MDEQTKYCYVAIGNTDNKLTQQEWALFVETVRNVLNGYTRQIHVEGYSLGDKPWQNVVWGFDIDSQFTSKLQEALRITAYNFQQDSIAWSETQTIFLTSS